MRDNAYSGKTNHESNLKLHTTHMTTNFEFSECREKGEKNLKKL